MCFGEPCGDLLSHGLPHYHRRSLVSRSCSGWEGVGPRRYGRKAKLGCRGVAKRLDHDMRWGRSVWVAECFACGCKIGPFIQGYRIKPYGQLVRLSSTCYHACTRRLSTLWSSTTLQGAQGSGKSHLEASFPLRCFQRLSLPSLATRQYDWRHNRYTRGSSTPVLSY